MRYPQRLQRLRDQPSTNGCAHNPHLAFGAGSHFCLTAPLLQQCPALDLTDRARRAGAS